MVVKVHYAIIEDPNSIFGSVGRCGSGYNTRWEDWSDSGRENIQKINDEWYHRYDAITQHYSKLEESILKEGFRNPLIITCGKPLGRSSSFFPPEISSLSLNKRLTLEGYDGGSRLWVAQKHNIPIPVIVNDRTGRFLGAKRILSKRDSLKYFKDEPKYFKFGANGMVATKLDHAHLDNEYYDPENQAAQIIPLWVELMVKYDYKPHVRKDQWKYLSRDLIGKIRTNRAPVRVNKIEQSNPSEIKEKRKELDKIDANEWDKTAYIVGGGYSLTHFDFDKLGRDKFVVAINESHKKLPDAQIVYFTDTKYWKPNKSSLLAHRGMLVRGSLRPNIEEKNDRVILMHLIGSNGLATGKGELKHGSNSTYAALNLLVAHLGFKKIYLLGIDMQWGSKGDKKTTHWHDGYAQPTAPPTYARMINHFKTLVKPLNTLGVEVINVVNPNQPSALDCFPTKTLQEIFN